MLLCLQASSQEIKTMRSSSLRVRLGVVTDMEKLIEYYIPEGFKKKREKWIPPEQRGKIIPFPEPQKKTA